MKPAQFYAAPRDVMLILAIAAVSYGLLLSQQFIGDGVRWLPQVTASSPPAAGGTSHFLFPYLAWLVYHLGEAVAPGVPAVTVLQSMNAIFGAVGLGLFYLLLQTVQLSRRAALVGTVMVGFSHAYFLHATDMTEPMPSVAPMLLGLILVRARSDWRWARLVGGAAIGLAAAFYQMALIALLPACIFTAARAYSSQETLRRWPILIAVGEIGAAGAVTFALIVGGGSLWNPSQQYGSGLAAIVSVPGYGLFGRADPRQLVGGAFGFANAFAPLVDWRGASRLLSLSPAILAYNLALAALAGAFALTLFFRLWANRTQLRERGQIGDVLAALAWLIAIYLIASYWAGTYEKLWIGGALAMGLLVALALDLPSTQGFIGSRLGVRRLLSSRTSLYVLLAAFGLLSLVVGAFPRKFNPNYDLAVARRIAEITGPGDLVVCGGWDAICNYLGTYLQAPVQIFGVAPEMVSAGFSADRLSERLEAEISTATISGKHVLFVDNILEIPPGEWNAFLGERLYIPYSLLDTYREQAALVEAIPRGPKEPILLKEFRGGVR